MTANELSKLDVTEVSTLLFNGTITQEEYDTYHKERRLKMLEVYENKKRNTKSEKHFIALTKHQYNLPMTTEDISVYNSICKSFNHC